MARLCYFAVFFLAILTLTVPPTFATDLDPGKAAKVKAATVCAACHGAKGTSVADHIPNLAGQRAAYLAAQLHAFKDGSRKSDIMNVIAAQLSEADIENAVAHFAAQTSASHKGKSAFLPKLAKTRVTFPANYPVGFTRYHAVNEPEGSQVKYYYANDKALTAAKAGKPLPDGSSIFIEIHAAKVGADKKPLMGSDGFFLSDRLIAYSTMARDSGWGNDVPEMLRNENWNYAIFTADRQRRASVNQAECLACHVPASKSSYVFTLKQLAGAQTLK